MHAWSVGSSGSVPSARIQSCWRGSRERAAVQGKVLQLALGYSHDVNYPIPAGIAIATPKPTEITISGIDKQQVGERPTDVDADAIAH